MTNKAFEKLIEYIDCRVKYLALQIDGRGGAHEHFVSEAIKDELRALLVEEK